MKSAVLITGAPSQLLDGSIPRPAQASRPRTRKYPCRLGATARGSKSDRLAQTASTFCRSPAGQLAMRAWFIDRRQASIVTTHAAPQTARFALHPEALPGNLCDGHALRRIPNAHRAARSSATRDIAATTLRIHAAFLSPARRRIRRRQARTEAPLRHRSRDRPQADGHLGRCHLKKERRR
jgi:hypothetical protein